MTRTRTGAPTHASGARTTDLAERPWFIRRFREGAQGAEQGGAVGLFFALDVPDHDPLVDALEIVLVGHEQ